MDTIIYLNGDYCKAGEVGISVYDRSFLFGEGLFETLRSYNERLFLLNAHIARMKESGKELEINVPLKINETKKIIKTLMTKNNISDSVFRITVTGGHAVSNKGKNSMKTVVCITPREIHPTTYILTKTGIPIMISKCIRDINYPFFKHKTLNYLQNIKERRLAFKNRTFESIFLNSKGHIAEGTISNIFMVKNGTVYTPPLKDNILPGITRSFIINKLCPQLKIKVKETPINLERLYKADEIFLTNSVFEIMPVKSISKKIDYFAPGRITSLLQEAYYAERKRLAR